MNVKDFDKKSEIKTEHKNLQKPIILCTGAFIEMKRQKLLIDAVANIEKASLVLLGKGEDKNFLEQYGRSKLNENFIITEVDYKDINYYYNLCDIFSLPSKDEPFGIVYIEAISANKPVVAPDEENRREIIGDAGLYVNVENVSAYSKALEECYKTDWKDVPKTRAYKFFDWNDISKKYINVINNVLKN